MPATALLVIDLQRGAFDGVRCPPVDEAGALIRNARALIDAARRSGTPIVFVQHCEGAEEPFEEGTAHWLLHEALVPAPGDLMLKKYASSSFENTELDAWLAERDVRNVVLCGLQSEFCVSNTARGALALGYAVRVARDGHGTWPSNGRTAVEIKSEADVALGRVGVELRATDELAQALREASA